MNKKELYQFLDSMLDGMIVERKVKEIERVIDGGYLKEYKTNLIKNFKQCPKCKKYFPKDYKFEIVIKEEIRRECIYTNLAGYGDDDEFGEVEYMVTYEKCPKCKGLVEKSKDKIRVVNKKDKWGNPI